MVIKPLLIGLGNILLTDEGVGVHVVNIIKERYYFSPEVEVVDGGTLGLDLLPLFEGREKVLFIDAVTFRKEPGHIGVLEDDEIPSNLSNKLSVHHIGLPDLLCAAQMKGIMPPKTILIGIQPETIRPGLEISDTLRSKIDEVIGIVIKILKGWNIECALRYPQK
jgi:hydrogenase maturation protease